MGKFKSPEIELKEKKLIKVLPHGSGINRNWKIEIKKDICYANNVYDYMNEDGYYENAYPFTVVYKPNDMYIKFKRLDDKDRRFIQKDGLRDYLEDLFYNVFPKVKTILW